MPSSASAPLKTETAVTHERGSRKPRVRPSNFSQSLLRNVHACLLETCGKIFRGRKILASRENSNFGKSGLLRVEQEKTTIFLMILIKFFLFDICFICVIHRDNNIQFLSEATVEFLEKHINKSNFHMKLGLNPYNCNCKAEFLHNFIDSHNGKMY